VLKGARVHRHTPASVHLAKRRGTEGWVGCLGRYGRVRKISPPPGFDLRTVSP